MHVGPPRQRNRVLGWLLASVLLTISLSVAATASAAPKLRFQTDVKGDIVTIGNALGQECRTLDTKGETVPVPVVGTVGACGDAITLGDSAPDVLWRSEDNSARADSTIPIDSIKRVARPSWRFRKARRFCMHGCIGAETWGKTSRWRPVR